MPEDMNKPELRDEMHQDLVNFNETKKSINEFIEYQRARAESDKQDEDKMNDYRSKAIDAINTLFGNK